MFRTLSFLLFFSLTVLLVTASAQAPAQDPPKLIEILSHDNGERVDANIHAILRQAGLHYIAGRTVAGELSRSITIVIVSDHAAIQRIPKTLNAIKGLRGVVLSLNEQLSLNIGHIPMSRATAYRLGFAYVRRGGTDEYLDEQKLAADLLRAANVRDEEFIAYMMRYGDDVPGVLFMTPMQNLGEIDKAVGHNPFGPEQERHRGLVLKDTVRRSEELLFIVRPEQSNPPEEYIRASPVFWLRRPE